MSGRQQQEVSYVRTLKEIHQWTETSKTQLFDYHISLVHANVSDLIILII